MFTSVSYCPVSDDDPLKKMVRDAIGALKEGSQLVQYPDGLTSDTWKSRYPEIDNLNAELLKAVQAKAGVYAILEHNRKGQKILRYIGQTDADGSRQRIRSHIVWRNKDTKSGKYTGSKFDYVQDVVAKGRRVSVSFVELAPSSLRHYVESKLLHHFSPEWNLQDVPSIHGIHQLRCNWDD